MGHEMLKISKWLPWPHPSCQYMTQKNRIKTAYSCGVKTPILTF